MEYALEGYGFAAARVVRNALAQRHGAGRLPPESRHALLLTLFEEGSATLSDSMFEELLEIWLGEEASAFERPPELLSTLRSLEEGVPGNGLLSRVASATKAAFDTLRQALQLRLAVCSLERDARGDEHMLLGVYAPSLSADVRVDDLVSAGALVALHRARDEGRCRLEVLRRVYRKVCQNGTIVFAGNAPAHELDPRLLFSSETLGRELERRIRACLDAKEFERAVDSFRRSAEEPVDGVAFAAALGASLGPETRTAVLSRYATAGDFTRWGLLNAVTAEARTAPSALMLSLERLGGGLAGLPAKVSAHKLRALAAAAPADMPSPPARLGSTTQPPLQRSKKTSAA